MDTRVKHVEEACLVSENHESQAIDLILSQFENQFLIQYLYLIAKEFNFYSFSYSLDCYNANFIAKANSYIQLQLEKPLVYDKSCPTVLPENAMVYILFFIE